jgi:hypothetical protein
MDGRSVLVKSGSPRQRSPSARADNLRRSAQRPVSRTNPAVASVSSSRLRVAGVAQKAYPGEISVDSHPVMAGLGPAIHVFARDVA